MIRLDPNLRWLYTELPIADRAAAAAVDGFRGVEVAFPYNVPAAVYRQELDALGLSLVQILSPLDWDAGVRGLACVAGREDEFLASVETAVAYAVDCGKPLIHAALGNLPSGASCPDAMAVARENLRSAARMAAPHGITIVVEACCAARFPDFVLHTVQETVRFLESVGDDNVKMCFDTYHVAMESADLLEQLDIAWPHIGHVQIGNVPERHEPGEGALDLKQFLDTLDRRGWDGWVGLEYTPRRGTAESLKWARDLGLLPERLT